MSWLKRIAYVLVIILLITAIGAIPDENQEENNVESEGDQESSDADRPESDTQSGDSGVLLEVTEVERPDPRLVTSYSELSEQTATIQNTGAAGEIHVELWITNNTVDTVDDLDTREEYRANGFELERAGTVFYESGERRNTSYLVSSENFEFYSFIAYPATYSGTIENRGGGGEANVSLQWVDSETGETKTVKSRTVPFEDGETQEVEITTTEGSAFDNPDNNYDQWRIIAEPVPDS